MPVRRTFFVLLALAVATSHLDALRSSMRAMACCAKPTTSVPD